MPTTGIRRTTPGLADVDHQDGRRMMYEPVPRRPAASDSEEGQFCRLCLSRTDDLCPLFGDAASVANKALLHKIFDCITITLSVRDDHDASICANCIVSIEAFFKYKAKCVENDRLLRRKRASFFAGLGLAAGDDADDDGDDDATYRQILGQSKRRRPNGPEENLVDDGDVDKVIIDDDEDDDRDERKPTFNGEDSVLSGDEADDRDRRRRRYGTKEEELIGDEDKQRAAEEQLVNEDADDDDDEEYFNPNQFLAQETQIEEDDEEDDPEGDGGGVSSDGHTPNGSGTESASASYERAWKTTEFAPQPGASGLRTLKITDYSNVTGKRGRAQRFEAGDGILSPANNVHQQHQQQLLAYQQREAVYRELQRLNGLAAADVSGMLGRMAMVVSPQGNPNRRSTIGGGHGGLLEPTKKVQKFLDDGLRELIYNAGAPNPHYARDGGSTNFKVVKARFNSYNIIFDDNRFLRRNKSVSGLPKWYWACSVTGCPVKICSYAGRLFKTNELAHTHPPTEPDADSRYETIQPDPHEAEQLQRQLLLQQQQQHEAQQQRLLRQQQQQQMIRQRQMELAQRRVLATAALMAAAAATANRTEEEPEQAHIKREKQPSKGNNGTEPTDLRWRNYELRRADDGTEILLSAGHAHRLIMTRKDGVRIYRCTSVITRPTVKQEDDGGGEGSADDVQQVACSDTVFLRTDGRLAKVCKEETVDYDMELPDDQEGCARTGAGAGADDDDKKLRRPQKIIVYEGYRYKYCHARPEGSFYWRCVLRHERDCLASIQTKRNLEFLNVNDQPHSHDPPDPSEPHENAMLCEIRLPAKGEQEEGSTDFKLVKSGQKREFLIYKGYRYYFQYESKNGRRSYRCTMFKNCPAGAFLLPNNTIQEAKNFIHTHPPVEDMEKYITKDSLITGPNKSGWVASVDGGDPAAMAAWKAAQHQQQQQQQQQQSVGTTPSTGGGGGGGRGAGSSSRGAPAVEPLSKDPEVARRNGYRIIKNYKNKEIMIYLGWRYFEDYKNKSGGQVWRCSSHRLCRGTVHLFPDGSINFARLVDHNHSPPKKILNHAGALGDDGSLKAATGDEVLELNGGAEGGLQARAAGTYHRYIMHQGHRFRFATRKREGTIYWRCAMRLETKCPVSFHTREDSYELVSTRNHEHNHPIPSVWPEVAGGRIDEELPKVRLPAEEIGTTDFILTKNSKGRDLVLYRNGRFYLDYSRKDGKIVFRCSAVSGCRATVLLLPNKTLQVPEDFSHNHPTADGLAVSPAAILRALKPEDDGDGAVLDGGDGEMNPSEESFDRSRLEASLPNVVLHGGFQYRFVSRHPTEQSAFYRCCNFDAKKRQCHASLYTDLGGVVFAQTALQPHNHEPGDYLQGPAVNAISDGSPTSASSHGFDTTDLIGTRDYKIVKNWKNRDVLVFQNCRYFLHYVRKDGRKVWRCSAIRSCHAAVYVNADGTVDQFRGQHVHEIRPEGEPRRRRRRKKAEMLPFPYAGGAGGAAVALADANRMAATMAAAAAAGMFGNGGPLGLPGNGAALNGNGAPGAMNGGSPSVAMMAAMMNGVAVNGGSEWIDYSDYTGVQQLSGTGNDSSGHGGREPEENQSLWDQFHPHQGLAEASVASEGGESFDFSYHSVFGNQDNFNSYTAHALAQHHLQQQQQQQLQQHHRSILQQRMQLLNGGGDQQPHVIEDSSDEEPVNNVSSHDNDDVDADDDDDDDRPIIVPEVKLEGDDL